MKNWTILLFITIATGCNSNDIIPTTTKSLICDDTSVFQFSLEGGNADNALKYYYDANNRIVGLEEIKPSGADFQIKYENSSLILTKKYSKTTSPEIYTFQLNKYNAIEGYEKKSDETTLLKGIYDYDIENHLVKFSALYTSITNPYYYQTHYSILKWKDDNISEIVSYSQFRDQEPLLANVIKFEYQNLECTNIDNFYNFAFFANPNINFESYISLEYLGMNKGKAPRNLPEKYIVSRNNGEVPPGGTGKYSYTFDEYKRVIKINVANGYTMPVDRIFRYLCH